MDWSLFHALNSAVGGSDHTEDTAEILNSFALFALAGAAALTWLLSTPGASRRSKRAAVAATGSAALGLLGNAALGHLWHHDRPFVDHPHQTFLLVPHGADNSFPSDHATVAFAIAFAVLAFHRRLGAVFLAGAVLVGLDRIAVGVHYPVDVAASVVVGCAAALVVTTLGRPYIDRVVDVLSRIFDPIVLAALRTFARLRRPRPR